MSYEFALGLPEWPAGCDEAQALTKPSCLPTSWPEATPRELASVRCVGDKPHGVRVQIPPGGETAVSRHFVRRWLSDHECDHHVSDRPGTEWCCRHGETGAESALVWGIPAGLVVAAGLVAGVWLLTR